MNNIREELCKTAQYFHHKGWMMGTAGNLSAKKDQHSFWITASGQSKGELTKEKFLHVHVNGKVLSETKELRPSAETSIHSATYNLFPTVHSCLHVHMNEGNWVCDDHQNTHWIPLPHLEMLKGFGWKKDLPVFWLRRIMITFQTSLKI